MKRLAITSTVLSVLLLTVGIYDAVTKYNWAAGDQNPLFGNQNVLLNDGTTILIAAGLFVVVTIVMWIMAIRKGQSDQRQS